ncbi:MAG: MerR family transcriptional regulator [Candidatus Hodarchaeota archaeon]
MEKSFPTKQVRRLTGATNNQLKYWVKTGLVCPKLDGKTFTYSFRDIIKLRVIVSLKENGLSLQKIKKGLKNLSEMLPDSDDLLSRLVIHTDGFDMIVNEKGMYFSATTMQRYFRFDTEQLKADIIKIQKEEDLLVELEYLSNQ